MYVYYDPMVISHARALYRSVPQDACGYLQADICDRAQVFASAALTLDLGQPVAVLMASVLHLIPDSDDPYRLARDVLASVAPGSYLLIVQKRSYRDHAQVTRFFTGSGLDLVSPGVVGVPAWRPEDELEAKAPTMAWCGVGRKPLAAWPRP